MAEVRAVEPGHNLDYPWIRSLRVGKQVKLSGSNEKGLSWGKPIYRSRFGPHDRYRIPHISPNIHSYASIRFDERQHDTSSHAVLPECSGYYLCGRQLGQERAGIGEENLLSSYNSNPENQIIIGARKHTPDLPSPGAQPSFPRQRMLHFDTSVEKLVELKASKSPQNQFT
ncbi:hypothetical protein BDP27DRAFT_1425666 [Rhodocollybia butyracea]|uniref:Uncharacterized protein n=1 Tax=Rhodocollybia butyracea TaxID=206335 RepID=A0A9P5U3J1_9AGAR|nr:hypothetical protein BDP27DRAFT_1425666 [Rhodocollybia butyracea]